MVKVVPGHIQGFPISLKNEIAGYQIHLGLDDDLRVRAINGKTWDLVPSHVFAGHYPSTFVNDYIHWRSDDIELRSLDDPWGQSIWHLKHNLSWQMSRGDQYVVGLQTPTSESICEVLAPLVTPAQICITIATSAKIEIPHLRLGFFLEPGSDKIQSRDHAAMYIDDDQDIGTLHGLRSKLVLRSDFDRLVLIPDAKPSDMTYPDVDITRHTGIVHVYDIDLLLERLQDRGTLRSKLFLAYLHALTSSCLPDELTKKTGTEAALSIMQSKVVLSYQSISHEDVNLVECLGGLTPIRQFYPKHLQVMQTVTWNNLSMLSQHPHFLTLAQHIIAHYRQYETCFRGSTRFPSFDKHNMHLHIRESIRTTSSISGYGQEDHTTKHDVVYQARHSRREHVFKAASMALDGNLCEAIPDWSLWKQFGTSFGPGHALGEVAYDASFIGKDAQAFVLENFMPLHLRLRQMDKHDFAIWLATLAFADVNFTLLQSLIILRQLTIDPPSIVGFRTGISPSLNEIKSILRRYKREFKSCPEHGLGVKHGESRNALAERKKATYEAAISAEINEVTSSALAQWPTDEPTLTDQAHLKVEYAAAIRAEFKKWHNSLLASQYIEKVQSALQAAKVIPIKIRRSSLKIVPLQHWHKCYVDEDDLFNTAAPDLPALPEQKLNHKKESVKNSDLYQLINSLEKNARSQYESEYAADLRASADALNNESISSDTLQCEEHLRACLDRIITSLTHSVRSTPRISTSLIIRQLSHHRWSRLSRPWKHCITQAAIALTHVQRAIRIAKGGQHNTGHNWNVMDHPEALLMEVESNILIRNVQMDVALQMINPSGNSTMELVMGQGKSSVCIPVIVVDVASTGVLTRVVVGKPQSKQMAQMLRAKLGGLIDRQIYFMPFTRALRFDKLTTQKVLKTMQECQATGGVLLLQPEHILSFQLMALERHISDEKDIGQVLLEAHNYLDQNSRDIVDECDENFSVKFELIYSIGRQNLVDGGSTRWQLWQEVLSILQEVAPTIAAQHPGSIELGRIRILRQDAVSPLINMIADCICEGISGLQIPRQSKALQSAIHTYLTQDITPDQAALVRLLLLRGLLAGGILAFVLSKRWRVQYGSAIRQPPTRLAVPYLAKDCPSARSEFSHPDVVILLTCLNFYYTGLHNDDLFATLAHLLRSDEADAIYTSWKPPSQFQLQGINLQDKNQCITELFPSLKHNKGAIDYFLDKFVFAKEMKEFPHKLSASGWDIGRIKRHPTTGFSGTSDARPLLPLAMHHIHLPASRATNALVLSRILRPENTVELGDILSLPVQVILDVGAQIVEMTNLEFAKSWLKQSTKEAVVYVNQQDEICVVDHDGNTDVLQNSRFASRLSACLVFLDEAHTRGIDLQLPSDYKAAGTLGAGLTKDRLVQACMRMRQLGNGQSVIFCIQEEIRQKLEEVSVMGVLKWTISETHAEIYRSMPLFAAQGKRFFQQEQLWRDSAYTDLPTDQFREKEALSIEERYRPCQDRSQNPDRRIAPRLSRFGQLNTDVLLHEEQERELAPENERERQRQVPSRAEPLEHSIHPSVRKFATTGIISGDGFMPAFQSLSATSAASQFDVSLLDSKKLWVTKDFAQTVDGKADGYHRSVQWISCNKTDIVIISPFEAEHLFDTFISLHLIKPHCNSGYAPLHLCIRGHAMPQDVRFTLFVGDLYLSSVQHYIELCRSTGLATESGNEVAADGFILRDAKGRVGGESGLTRSPVRFLQTFLSNVRRNGDGISRTHMGRLLNGELLHKEFDDE